MKKCVCLAFALFLCLNAALAENSSSAACIVTAAKMTTVTGKQVVARTGGKTKSRKKFSEAGKLTDMYLDAFIGHISPKDWEDESGENTFLQRTEAHVPAYEDCLEFVDEIGRLLTEKEIGGQDDVLLFVEKASEDVFYPGEKPLFSLGVLTGNSIIWYTLRTRVLDDGRLSAVAPAALVKMMSVSAAKYRIDLLPFSP